MFDIFKPKQTGSQVKFQVTGMHCTSCGMNIDGELEETAGVFKAQTNYAKSETTVSYDPEKTTPEDLKKVIEKLDYQVAQKK